MYNNTLYDQHLHTSFSEDCIGGYTIENVIEAALGKGLAGIAVTDHFDPRWPEAFDPFELDIPAYNDALYEAERLCEGRIRFAKGIELGLLLGENNEICAETVQAYPYDFVIGSVHYSKTVPTHIPVFVEGRTTKEIVEEYYALVLENVKDYKDYDVLGHINSIDRYTDGFAPPDLWLPYVEEIFRVAVADGKGIEINTSSFRYGISEHGTPTLAMLKLFKELGGEIVTIGSDAHRLSDVGTNIEKGEEMLLASGFRYFAVFNERRPEFIKL